MRNLHNIEKSAFHAGDYVGYGNGVAYRITKHGRGVWRAFARCAVVPPQNAFIVASTLSEMSRKLDALKS